MVSRVDWGCSCGGATQGTFLKVTEKSTYSPLSGTPQLGSFSTSYPPSCGPAHTTYNSNPNTEGEETFLRGTASAKKHRYNCTSTYWEPLEINCKLKSGAGCRLQVKNLIKWPFTCQPVSACDLFCCFRNRVQVK